MTIIFAAVTDRRARSRSRGSRRATVNLESLQEYRAHSNDNTETYIEKSVPQGRTEVEESVPQEWARRLQKRQSSSDSECKLEEQTGDCQLLEEKKCGKECESESQQPEDAVSEAIEEEEKAKCPDMDKVVEETVESPELVKRRISKKRSLSLAKKDKKSRSKSRTQTGRSSRSKTVSVNNNKQTDTEAEQLQTADSQGTDRTNKDTADTQVAGRRSKRTRASKNVIHTAEASMTLENMEIPGGVTTESQNNETSGDSKYDSDKDVDEEERSAITKTKRGSTRLSKTVRRLSHMTNIDVPSQSPGSRRGTFSVPPTSLIVPTGSPASRRGTFAIPSDISTNRRGTFAVITPVVSPAKTPVVENSLVTSGMKSDNHQDKKEWCGTFIHLPSNMLPGNVTDTKARRQTYQIDKPINDYLDVENLLEGVDIGNMDLVLENSEDKSQQETIDKSDAVAVTKAMKTESALYPAADVNDETIILEEDMELTRPISPNSLLTIVSDSTTNKRDLPPFITPEASLEPVFLKDVSNDNAIDIPEAVMNTVIEEVKQKRISQESDGHKSDEENTKKSKGQIVENWESKLPRPLPRKSKTQASKKIKTVAEDECKEDGQETAQVEESGENGKPKSKMMAFSDRPGKITFRVGRKGWDQILMENAKPRSKSRSTLPSQVKPRKSRSKPRAIPDPAPQETVKEDGTKSVFDLSMNDSITLPTTSYSQFKDRHKSSDDESYSEQEPSSSEVTSQVTTTDSTHGILLVLGNGTRTKPSRNRSKSVSYAKKLVEVHFTTPDTPPKPASLVLVSPPPLLHFSTSSDEGDMSTPPRDQDDATINCQSAGNTPLRPACSDKHHVIVNPDSSFSDMVPPTQPDNQATVKDDIPLNELDAPDTPPENPEVDQPNVRDAKKMDESDFGSLFDDDGDDDVFKSPKQKKSRKQAMMEMALNDSTNLPPGQQVSLPMIACFQ